MRRGLRYLVIIGNWLTGAVGIPRSIFNEYVREIFDDWLTRAAGIIFILIVGLVIFTTVSDLPEKYPLFGVFSYSLVPILFTAGGVVFVLTILREIR